MEAPLNGPVDAFRAVDAFAVDAWKIARQLARGDGDTLSQELRAQVARCGGALLASMNRAPGVRSSSVSESGGTLRSPSHAPARHVRPTVP